jgi:hypothetical protein
LRSMKLFIYVLLATLALSGCSPDGVPLGAGGVTVSGSATAPYWNITSSVTVTVTQGSNSYSTQVSAQGTGSSIYFSFSIPNVPMGTYSVTISFAETNVSSPRANTYALNAGVPLPTSDTCTGSLSPYDYTMSVSGVVVNADTTVDLTLQNMG